MNLSIEATQMGISFRNPLAFYSCLFFEYLPMLYTVSRQKSAETVYTTVISMFVRLYQSHRPSTLV